ncbi:hypothetical protein [Nitrobacter hamburgensis]|uniref:hypothetical protein n=1 Tax=Nitrobacter hamburgensis TaxID=912 RepID=UPI00030E9EE0|nr:hypothetical protein [Nitrobacter hamburgensis]
MPATEIEQLIERTIRERLNLAHTAASDIFDGVDRAVINSNHIRIAVKPAYAGRRPIEIPWKIAKTNAATVIEPTDQSKSDPKLLQAIVRAHAWLNELTSGRHDSIEALAKDVRLHPKIIRQQLRLAFLAPSITEAALTGEAASTLSLRSIPKLLPISWTRQRKR